MRPLGTGSVLVSIALVVVVYLAGVVFLVAAVQLLVTARRRRWLVGYFTADATQLVHPDPTGAWILSDHFARRRGHGPTDAFRQQVFAHLAAEAHQRQAVIVMDTHAGNLAELYTQAMPG